MFFERVKNLIEYLEEFNPDARVLTNMGFSWSKPMGETNEDTRKTTNILYIYGEYYPQYDKVNDSVYFDLKDYIDYELDTKYNILRVKVKLPEDSSDEPVNIIVYHYPELTLRERQKKHYNLIMDVLEYCRVNDCEDLLDKIIIRYVPGRGF